MKVIGMLDIDVSETLFIEKNPERKNIRYCVEYVESDKEVIGMFYSIINELICSRRLIYTQTRNQCAAIYNAFCSDLGNNIYQNCEANPRFLLVDMFHGGTPESVKKHIVAQLAIPDSCLRVVICTVAFGMGVNCSNVNESNHFGAQKSLEAYIQESGRIGRNDSTSISRIRYNAMLLRATDHQMRNYIKEARYVEIWRKV
jgi:superfamily II DNA helicase RecQ